MSPAADPTLPRIEARGLSFARGGRRILDDVSVSFGAGLTAVIGPNGAGKSTLLSLLAGLARPDAGEVRINGEAIGAIAPRRLARLRSYLPQSARCEWPIAAERVVALGLTPSLPILGDLAPADQARVEAAIAAWDIAAVRTQSALTLSGGELVRTMLARALVGDPSVVFADEPIAGLDPRHAFDAMARLAAYGRNGRAVVAAIHDLALAARYADNIIALKGGRVFAAGATEAVLNAATLQELFDVEARVERTELGLELKLLGARL